MEKHYTVRNFIIHTVLHMLLWWSNRGEWDGRDVGEMNSHRI